MKRFAVLVFLSALLAGAGFVFWPTSERSADDATPAVAAKKPAPKVEKRPVQAPVQPVLTNGSIAGGVHRRGVGVKGATLTAKGNGPAISVTSTDGGGFLFDALPPGSYLLSATFGDEASRVLGPIELGNGEKKTGVVLELLASATISGSVLNAVTREPVPNARVSSGGQNVLTTSAGRFELRGVSVGEAWLEVTAKGYMPRTEWLTVDGARKLGGMEIVLGPSATVRGVVTRQGSPVANAQVFGQTAVRAAADLNGASTALTDPTGHYELELAAEKVSLFAAAAGEARVNGPTLTLAPGEVHEGADIELGQQLIATGIVTVGGRPASSAEVGVFDARSGQLVASAICDGAGGFQVAGLSPGPYLVQARANGIDGQRGPFQLTGADDAPWEVQLDAEGVIRGKVLPKAAGVAVRMRGTEWAGQGAQTFTDSEGQFSFTGAAGPVVVSAESESGSAEAKAQPGEEVTLNLEPAVLHGSVFDEAGHAVTDFSIRLRPLSGGPTRTYSELSPLGTFRIQTPPGSYEVSAFAAGSAWAPPVQGESVRGGEGGEVRLTMSSTVRFAAHVIDSRTKAPIVGAEAQIRVGFAYSASVFATVKTDAGGNFEVRSAPRAAVVMLTAPGYQTRFFGVHDAPPDGKPVEIAMGPGGQTEWEKPYEGVGLAWKQDPKNPFVVGEVFPGSPAEGAGIRPDDVLISIDSQPTSGMDMNRVIALVRGAAGTSVRLGFLRAGVPYEVIVRRQAISL